MAEVLTDNTQVFLGDSSESSLAKRIPAPPHITRTCPYVLHYIDRRLTRRRSGILSGEILIQVKLIALYYFK
jgi:hypothetical protein